MKGKQEKKVINLCKITDFSNQQFYQHLRGVIDPAKQIKGISVLVHSRSLSSKTKILELSYTLLTAIVDYFEDC